MARPKREPGRADLRGPWVGLTGERLKCCSTRVSARQLTYGDFANRLPSRAAAVRELLKRGLLNRDLAPPATKDVKTSDFTVMPETRDAD